MTEILQIKSCYSGSSKKVSSIILRPTYESLSYLMDLLIFNLVITLVLVMTKPMMILTHVETKFHSLKKSKGTVSLQCIALPEAFTRSKSTLKTLVHQLRSLTACQMLIPCECAAAIRAVLSKPNKFTDGMEYDICVDKHTFDKYKTFLGVSFLQTHFIA